MPRYTLYEVMFSPPVLDGGVQLSETWPVPAVAVSAVTGAGLPALLSELNELAGSLPLPDPGAPVTHRVTPLASPESTSVRLRP